jgi:hypothetical protein
MMKAFLSFCILAVIGLAFGSALIGWTALRNGEWGLAIAMAFVFALNGYNLNTFWGLLAKQSPRV